MKIIKYPDNTAYVDIEKSLSRNYTVKINSYEDLWHLRQLVDACNYNDIIPEITIPNLIDAQADRRFGQYHSNGLKLVCEFLNSMNADFKIFHPHNPEVVEALIDRVQIIDNKDLILKVLENICPMEAYNSTGAKVDFAIYPGDYIERDINNLILMSSDAGGFKPLMKLCDKLNWQGEIYSASKARGYKDGKSTLTQIVDRQDFNGKDILIIDDICVYGGTFKGLSNLLKERNCGKLYLAVSHMTIQNLGKDSVTNYFDKVFTSNSKYNKYLASYDMKMDSSPSNLEIIKLF